MELSKLKELTSGGKIFSCLFTKRTDGSERLMVARVGVAKDLAGSERNWDPDEKGLLIVYDMQARGYRHIPAEAVRQVKAHKQTHTFDKSLGK